MPAVGTERGDRALSGGEPTKRNGSRLTTVSHPSAHWTRLWHEAIAKGWIVISMKDDWKTIFPPAGTKE